MSRMQFIPHNIKTRTTMEKEKKVKIKYWLYMAVALIPVSIIFSNHKCSFWEMLITCISILVSGHYFDKAKAIKIQKAMDLYTVQISFVEDINYPGGGYFDHTVFKSSLKRKWFIFSLYVNKICVLKNVTDKAVIEFLDSQTNWNIFFEKGTASSQKAKEILNTYYDDCICDIITEVKTKS